MAIKLEMLRSFCAVAEAGNLADAADRLGRTQSAVSMTLKQLEQTLGGALFEGERKNRLTPLGEQVFRLGLTQLKHFDSTIEAITLLGRAPQGVLRIAAVPSVAALAFPPIIRFTTRHFPGLKVELRDADTAQVIDSLVQGWADIGIASSHQRLKGVTVSELFDDRFGLVLHESHPLARQPGPIRPEDVFAVPFLRNALCDQIRTPEIQEHLGRVDVSVYNTQSLLAMVGEGDWVTLLPYSAYRLAQGGLAFRPVANLPDMRQAFLYARDRPSAPAPTAEIERLVRSLKWSPED